MHGRLKVRTTEEQKAIKLKEQNAKAEAYTKGLESIFTQRSQSECNTDTLNLIAKLLSVNPDINTLWNIRREVLLGAEDHIKQEVVGEELALTEHCLRVNPKSYSAWHHRCWTLNHCPEPNWNAELELCDKYLKLDERNFHCWDYRRFVVDHAKVSDVDELKFSTEKIMQNFSNYSSWHYRSVLYKTLSPKSDTYKTELDLVQNAAFTDPYDTSAWFYQRWLLGKTDDPLKIILAYCTPSITVVSTTNCIGGDVQPKLIVNEVSRPLDWRPLDQSVKYSNTWIVQTPDEIILQSDCIEVAVYENDTKIDSLKLQFVKKDNEARGESNVPLGVNFHAELRITLEEQLSTCQELLELEPDSKWTLLTTALLMRGLGGATNNIQSIHMLEKLQTCDKLRSGYYKDLTSRWILEDFLNERMKTGSLFSDIEILSPSVTVLYHSQYLRGALTVTIADIKIRRRNVDLTFKHENIL